LGGGNIVDNLLEKYDLSLGFGIWNDYMPMVNPYSIFTMGEQQTITTEKKKVFTTW
jgi:hypothetical protein